VAVPNAVTILQANLSETNVLKVELIDQTGVMTTATTMMMQKQKPDANLIPNVTTTMDGTEIENESEELAFDDSSDVDYDLDYTVQY
jgi:hypothetical protein